MGSASLGDWDSIEQVDEVEDYDEYLQSSAWRRKRKYMLQRAGRRCQVCNTEKNLEVHHRTYDRLGHEDPADLTVLCRGCHEAFHNSGRVLVSDLSHRSEWAKPYRIASVVFAIAAVWAYFNMHQWATYDTDPSGYIWRWWRFLALTLGAIFLYDYPPKKDTVLLCGGIAVGLMFLPWLLG